MDAPFPAEMMPEIARFFDRPLEPPGRVIYNSVFETNLFFPLQRKREMHAMINAAMAVRPKVIMDIGSDKGGGLYHWCQIPGVERIIACEVRGLPYRHLFEANFPGIQFTWLEASSYAPETVQQVRDLGVKIDVLFIDGCKAHMEVDFDNYRPMLNSRCVVFVHDITDEAPGAQFANIARKFGRASTIIDRSEGEMAAKPHFVPQNAYEGWLSYWAGASCGVGVLHG